MYWGWGAQIVPSVGRRWGHGSGGAAQSSLSRFRQAAKAAGKFPARRCLFGSLSWWMSRTTGRFWACLSCSMARRRSRFPSCSRCRYPSARWSVGLVGRGSFVGTMSPRSRSRCQILRWKVKMIRAARNVIVAPTNAEVNSNARSNISLFIGG